MLCIIKGKTNGALYLLFKPSIMLHHSRVIEPLLTSETHESIVYFLPILYHRYDTSYRSMVVLWYPANLPNMVVYISRPFSIWILLWTFHLYDLPNFLLFLPDPSSPFPFVRVLFHEHGGHFSNLICEEMDERISTNI